NRRAIGASTAAAKFGTLSVPFILIPFHPHQFAQAILTVLLPQSLKNRYPDRGLLGSGGGHPVFSGFNHYGFMVCFAHGLQNRLYGPLGRLVACAGEMSL